MSDLTLGPKFSVDDVVIVVKTGIRGLILNGPYPVGGSSEEWYKVQLEVWVGAIDVVIQYLRGERPISSDWRKSRDNFQVSFSIPSSSLRLHSSISSKWTTPMKIESL